MASKGFFSNPAIRKWAYSKSGFNRYGLYRDDVLYETPVVKEALKRLPSHLLDGRNFRIVRALQLSCQKIYLPKEQWIKFEEDEHYLMPYIKEVEKEIQEKEEWNKE